jgi:hypothetical protein
VTASFAPSPADSGRRSPLAAIVIGVAGTAAFLGLVLAGLVFFALAIAFPIAVPLATAIGAPVTARDAELASRFAGFAWAFVALSVASFGAALAALALTVRSVAPTEE